RIRQREPSDSTPNTCLSRWPPPAHIYCCPRTQHPHIANWGRFVSRRVGLRNRMLNIRLRMRGRLRRLGIPGIPTAAGIPAKTAYFDDLNRLILAPSEPG